MRYDCADVHDPSVCAIVCSRVPQRPGVDWIDPACGRNGDVCDDCDRQGFGHCERRRSADWQRSGWVGWREHELWFSQCREPFGRPRLHVGCGASRCARCRLHLALIHRARTPQRNNTTIAYLTMTVHYRAAGTLGWMHTLPCARRQPRLTPVLLTPSNAWP